MPQTPVICPRCQTPFECGIDTARCWCNDIDLAASTRAAFAEFYDGCLCRDCLAALDEDRPTAPTVRQFLTAQLRRRRG